eukprot:SAG22_NODE_1580_length_4066_cov_3.253844_1_plen_245_part_00
MFFTGLGMANWVTTLAGIALLYYSNSAVAVRWLPGDGFFYGVLSFAGVGLAVLGTAGCTVSKYPVGGHKYFRQWVAGLGGAALLLGVLGVLSINSADHLSDLDRSQVNDAALRAFRRDWQTKYCSADRVPADVLLRGPDAAGRRLAEAGRIVSAVQADGSAQSEEERVAAGETSAEAAQAYPAPAPLPPPPPPPPPPSSPAASDDDGNARAPGVIGTDGAAVGHTDPPIATEPAAAYQTQVWTG